MEKEKMLGKLMERAIDKTLAEHKMDIIIKRIHKFTEYFDARSNVERLILSVVAQILNSADIKLKAADYDDDEFDQKKAATIMLEIVQKAAKDLEDVRDKKEE